jgi:retinoblastoma-like protein 1
MASASWLHAIVAPPSPNGTPKPGTIVLTPTQRLKRFVSEDVAKKLMDLVHNLAGKTSAALREDAFLVTINGVGALAGQGHNVSLGQPGEAAAGGSRAGVRLLSGAHPGERATAGDSPGGRSLSAPDASAGETNKSPAAPEPKVKKGGLKPDAFGSVADIAAMAAEQKEDALMPPPPPTDEQRLGFEALLGSGRFVRSVLACSMEVVVASYKTATLKFPAIPRLLGLDAFDVSSIIEPFVRADTTMPREVKKHFNALEETIMETLAWSKGSSLFGFMRAAESGYLPRQARRRGARGGVRRRGQPRGDRPGLPRRRHEGD